MWALRPVDVSAASRPFEVSTALRPSDVSAALRPFDVSAALRPFDRNMMMPERHLFPTGSPERSSDQKDQKYKKNWSGKSPPPQFPENQICDAA